MVFVSLDKDAESFDATRANMPWPALPFGGTRAALLAELFLCCGSLFFFVCLLSSSKSLRLSSSHLINFLSFQMKTANSFSEDIGSLVLPLLGFLK